MAAQVGFKNPLDTGISAGLRFVVELLAWVAGPWAVAQQSVWLAIPAALILIGLPAIFSTVGDKKQVVVATPGPLRLGLEMALYGVAVAGAWLAWPAWLAIVVTTVVIVAFVTGIPRAKWLLRGAAS